MILRRGIIIIAISLVLFNSPSAEGNFPEPVGYVSDFAEIIDTEWKGKIGSLIKELESKTTAEIAVVTIDNLSPYSTIEEYAEALFSDWKIGKAKEDNGVLLLVSIKERKIRIETGYRIEPIIPDGVAGEIIRNEIAPSLKAGRYGEGLYRGTYAIAERISKEKGITLEGKPATKKRNKGQDILPPGIIIPLIFLIMFLIILNQIFGLSHRKRGMRGWSSGMFSGGFGGSSGGGFSGGFGGFGGSSGGGGASGDW